MCFLSRCSSSWACCCWRGLGFSKLFGLLLIKPILDKVLNPASGAENIQLFTIPGHGTVYLQQFVPLHFHGSAWTIVAYALVVSSILRGVFDYAGTYLVNHAGFGMITNLRNDLYNSLLKRSAAFFQKHTSGTLISTIVNDIERVQYAMSSILAEFLQQFFTLLFTAAVVIVLGRQLAWVLLLFIPFIVYSAMRIGRQVRQTTRGGQDKLADIQNVLQETITGNRIVKAFSMENWEMARFRAAAQRLFRANLRSVAASSISSPLMDVFGAITIALLLLLGRNEIVHAQFTLGRFVTFIAAVFSLYNPVRKFALFYNSFQQAAGASSEVFQFHGYGRRSPGEVRRQSACRLSPRASASKRSASPTMRPAMTRTRCLPASIWKSKPVKFWRWSDRVAPAKVPWSICCRGFSTSAPAAFWWMAVTCAMSR